MNIIEYKIDENNNIIYVNEEWDCFALENNGEEIVSDKIIGRNLFDFVENITVKHIYLHLLDKVRKGNKILIDYRCDSPTYKRFLQLTIKPEDNSIIRFISREKEILPQNYLRILDSKSIRSKKFIPMCLWCKKIKVEDEWEELEQAINKYDLLNQLEVPSLTHTICEECYQQLNTIMKPS